ncbi:MAG: hypothetical protein H8E66_31545 [Planctomycetes bacterium]|nr:hypothetical protein [Planctomycetota bacterium]
MAPPVVSLCKWAVAGGLAGWPVQIVFRDHPAPVMAELYRQFTAWIGTEKTLSIHGSRDLRQIEEQIDNTRLIYLFDPKLLTQLSWLLAMTSTSNKVAQTARPAVFVSQHHQCVAEGPGPTLTFHGSSPRLKALTQWLSEDGRLGEALPGLSPVNVEFDQSIHAVIDRNGVPSPALEFGLRERQILRGLMAGVAVLHSQQATGLLKVTADHYEEVYKPLQSAAVKPVDDSFDPLALAMIRRTNAYLKIRTETDETKVSRAESQNILDRDAISPVTRREVTNLGNLRGATVKELIRELQRRGDAGFKIFLGIGTCSKIDCRQGWPTNEATHLARLLIPWTEKQVRTHFHRLHTDGLIEARRASGNKAWQYVLPEAMSSGQSPFQALPSPNSFKQPQDANDNHRPPVVCPADGQTEVQTVDVVVAPNGAPALSAHHFLEDSDGQR